MLVGLLVISLLSLVAGGDRCVEDGVYDGDFDKCYHFSTATLNCEVAQLVCESLNGDLVSISSAFEESFVIESARSHFGAGDFWIGLWNPGGDNVWKWKDGSIPTYTNWVSGYPTSVNWVQSVASSVATGQWYNRNGTTAMRYFVCQTSPLPTTTREPTSTPTPPTPMTPDPFMWKEFNGSFYQLTSAVTNPVWSTVETICERNYAMLTSIHSDEENDFIRDFATGGILSMKLWIGLQWSDGGSTFVWVDGTPADYANWEGASVSSGGCGYLAANGKWNLADCDISGNSIPFAMCKFNGRQNTKTSLLS